MLGCHSLCFNQRGQWPSVLPSFLFQDFPSTWHRLLAAEILPDPSRCLAGPVLDVAWLLALGCLQESLQSHRGASEYMSSPLFLAVSANESFLLWAGDRLSRPGLSGFPGRLQSRGETHFGRHPLADVAIPSLVSLCNATQSFSSDRGLKMSYELEEFQGQTGWG